MLVSQAHEAFCLPHPLRPEPHKTPELFFLMGSVRPTTLALEAPRKIQPWPRHGSITTDAKTCSRGNCYPKRSWRLENSERPRPLSSKEVASSTCFIPTRSAAPDLTMLSIPLPITLQTGKMAAGRERRPPSANCGFKTAGKKNPSLWLFCCPVRGWQKKPPQAWRMLAHWFLSHSVPSWLLEGFHFSQF